MQHIAGPASYVQRVLPDGCVDIIWQDAAGLTVAGPATHADLPQMPGDATTLGVRFHPGGAPAALGVPAAELRDGGVDLEALWDADARRLEDRLTDLSDPRLQLQVLNAAVSRRIAAVAPDELVAAAVRHLEQPGTPVAALAEALGISGRQLRRRFHDAVGYGPKVLDRVLRLQRFLAIAEAPGETHPLAVVAAEAGYADQAHLDHDCLRLSGLSPTDLLGTRRAVA
jgi:AraC-like DNA-binding protein